MRSFVTALIPLLAVSAQSLHSAEQPLGIVQNAQDQQVTVQFDGSVQLIPGTMLAVYGPGLVQKHPLTKEVIVEGRKMVAKLQIINAIDPQAITARITWNEGTIGAGYDVVPLPSEAAPNSAPAAVGKMPNVEEKVKSETLINLPITDPDGDIISVTWGFEGASGKSGTLSARTTTSPSIKWIAPGAPGKSTIVATVTDRFGQQVVEKITVTAKADDNWRQLKPIANVSLGYERQFPIARLSREPDGSWLGVDSNGGKIYRTASGWLTSSAVNFEADQAPTRPVVAHTQNKLLHVLDARRAGVFVYGANGNRVRDYGHGVSPTDFLLADDGTAFIADQQAGGVLVYEASGAFRVRLGRPGKGDDAFTGLTRIAINNNGDLLALDVAQSQIQRFDRFHRRLPTWKLQTDASNPAVDIAVHPAGTLVLLSSGQVLIADKKGQTPQAWKGLSDAGWVPRAGLAQDVFVDANGEVYVTYPEYGWTLRYDKNGTPNGVRGSTQWDLTDFAMDGQGRFIGLHVDTAKLWIFDAEGWLTNQIGGYEKHGGPFARVGAIAVAPDGRHAAVLDTSAMHVVLFDLENVKAKPLIFGQPGKNDGQFSAPLRVAIDEAGHVYVLDAKLRRVQVFDEKGSFLFSFGRYERGKMADELLEPTQLAVSPTGDAAYVYDYDTYEVKKFAIDQEKKQAVHVNNTGGKGSGPAQFRSIVDMFVDRMGLLYVLDDSRDDLQVLDFRGGNAVAGPTKKFEELGVRGGEFFSVSPDGHFIIVYDGAVSGWHW